MFPLSHSNLSGLTLICQDCHFTLPLPRQFLPLNLPNSFLHLSSLSPSFPLSLLPSSLPGTEILTVQAADNDDPKTDNVRIFYRLVGQVPESPRALFRVDRDSGVISVQADSMEGTAPQYTLTITAEDAKGDYLLYPFH